MLPLRISDFRQGLKKRNRRVLQKPSRVVGVVSPSVRVRVSLIRFIFFSITANGGLSLVKKRPRIASSKVREITEVALDIAI